MVLRLTCLTCYVIGATPSDAASVIASKGTALDIPLLLLGQVLDRLPLEVERLGAASLLLFTFLVLFHFSSFVPAFGNHHLSPFLWLVQLLIFNY